MELVKESRHAATMLHPMRLRILDALREPGSASTVARELGLARQKVNYHLRALEAHGLAKVAGERRWGGLTPNCIAAKRPAWKWWCARARWATFSPAGPWTRLIAGWNSRRATIKAG